MTRIRRADALLKAAKFWQMNDSRDKMGEAELLATDEFYFSDEPEPTRMIRGDFGSWLARKRLVSASAALTAACFGLGIDLEKDN